MTQLEIYKCCTFHVNRGQKLQLSLLSLFLVWPAFKHFAMKAICKYVPKAELFSSE